MSSIVLSLRRERAGGIGPAVEAPRFVVFDLLAFVAAVVEGAWDCDVVARSDGFSILPKAFKAGVEEGPKVEDVVLIVSTDLSCGLPKLGKKLAFGAFVDGADAPLLVAALLAAMFPKRLILGAAVGDFTIPLEAAAVLAGFEKLIDGADGCFWTLANIEGALVVLAVWLFEADGLARFENKFGLGLFSAVLLVTASWDWVRLLKRPVWGCD